MRCSALTFQKSLRDLANLPVIAGQVDWVETSEAEKTDGPLVVCALWLWEKPEEAKSILRARSQSGRCSLVVPRFRSGDLAQVLISPTSVLVKPGEFNSLLWEERQYRVSGTSVFDSALHAAKWATSVGVGTVILGYRAHAAAAPIVLCSAAVTGRPLGVQVEEQRSLFERIIETASSQSVRKEVPTTEGKSAGRAPSLDAFLEEEGNLGAAFLMAKFASGEGCDVRKSARDILSIDFSNEQLAHLEDRVPELCGENVEEVLRRRGWGPYLRRIESLTRRESDVRE
jgi:hypothetical protein